MPNFDPKPLVVSSDNGQILDTLKNLASNDYQRRVPDAMQAGVKKTVDAMWSYKPTRNEAIDALVNLIGLQVFRSNSWQNPLAKFKKGYFEYGVNIQETKVGLLKQRVYDANRDVLEGVLFGTHKPEVESFFHTLNRQGRYDLTVQYSEMRQAFYDEGGLNNFITSLMESPNNSDQWDEFLLMANLFRIYYDAGGFFKVHVDDLSNIDADSDDARDAAQRALRTMRAIGAHMAFYSRTYNAAHMYATANPDELELFITPEAQAAFDVDALAGAFNIERAEVPFRVTVVPAERFNIPGCQAILTTKDFFQVYDSLFDTQQQPNPAHLSQNYFLHHWQVISASLFVPAIMFWTGASDEVVDVYDPVASVQTPTVLQQDGTAVTDVVRGDIYQVNTLAVTTPTGGVNDSVILSLTGATSDWTRITQTGVLVIGINEGSNTEGAVDTLTIVATSVDDPTKTASTTVNVVGDYANLWPDPAVATDSDDDGLFEVTPAVPDFTDNVVTVPAVTGVVYSNGATALTNGSTVNVANGTPVTITAAARAGNELAVGAPTSWTFTYVAPAS